MKRSKFSLSNYKLASMNMGNLVPIGISEVLPGDTFQHSTSALIRCSPLLAPVMHPVRVSLHHWYVPTRIIWEDFEDFITGGPDGMDASAYPTITFSGGSQVGIGHLGDYLGLPTGVDITVSALPFRAYNLIWNEWYRDQDLDNEAPISYASGADATTNVDLERAAWEKDYFTSARPWEQKGPSITVPLGTTAPVHGDGQIPQVISAGDLTPRNLSVNGTLAGKPVVPAGSTEAGHNDMQFASQTGLITDLSSASGVTVNILREALALQRYEEARARYGSRYVEYLRYLNVRSSDARLQRPEYLGGGRQTIQFSEVLQTGEGTNPVGELRGHGVAAMRSNRYRRFFEEHGHVITLMSVRPKTIYQDGVARMWSRDVKEKYWQQELQHIGQQEILNKEVYAAHTTPEGTFGFQDRYDEYRRQESTVAGEFRNSTLNYWHFARQFGSDPALNATFVRCTPTERTFAVPSEDVLYVMANHSIQARRLVAKTGKSYIY
jgi:hypothetical protein